MSNKINNFKKFIFTFIYILISFNLLQIKPVFAVFEVQVSSKTSDKIPLIVVVNRKQGAIARDIALEDKLQKEIVGLLSSSVFKATAMVNGNSSSPATFKAECEKITCGGVLFITLERMEETARGSKISVNYQLVDYILGGKTLLSSRKLAFESQWIRVSATISDEIYSTFTAYKGYFDSYMVFIAEQGNVTRRSRRMAIMDYGGDRFEFLTDGKDIVSLPSASPNGKYVAYLRYVDSKTPAVYIMDLATKNSKAVQFAGMTYAPKFARDEKNVIMSAVYGSSHSIASYNIETETLTRLTTGNFIDTSPEYSPDGSKIVFASSRGTGGNNLALYMMNADGSNIQKISSGGGSYDSPRWSPDERYIVFSKVQNGRFSIGILNLSNLKESLLTNSYKDDYPAWAPNGKAIMFTRRNTANYNKDKGISELLIIDLNGNMLTKIQMPFDISHSDWRAFVYY